MALPSSNKAYPQRWCGQDSLQLLRVLDHLHCSHPSMILLSARKILFFISFLLIFLEPEEQCTLLFILNPLFANSNPSAVFLLTLINACHCKLYEIISYIMRKRVYVMYSQYTNKNWRENEIVEYILETSSFLGFIHTLVCPIFKLL